MKRIKATAETRELKELIKWQREKIIKLETRIDVLEEELIESRAKEGKGCLETVMESLTKAFSSMDFSKLIDDHLEIDSDEDDT